jgi:hypothetical protein
MGLTGRDRLGAQLACLHSLESFVPFAAATSVSASAAGDWLAENQTLARAALSKLRGHGQLTLMAKYSAQPEQNRTPNGADWLRARMGEKQRAAALGAYLNGLVKDQDVRDHALKFHDQAVRFDLCIPLKRSAEVRQIWASTLSHPTPQTTGWHATLTGAWPAAAFWKQGALS